MIHPPTRDGSAVLNINTGDRALFSLSFFLFLQPVKHKPPEGAESRPVCIQETATAKTGNKPPSVPLSRVLCKGPGRGSFIHADRWSRLVRGKKMIFPPSHFNRVVKRVKVEGLGVFFGGGSQSKDLWWELATLKWMQSRCFVCFFGLFQSLQDVSLASGELQ